MIHIYIIYQWMIVYILYTILYVYIDNMGSDWVILLYIYG